MPLTTQGCILKVPRVRQERVVVSRTVALGEIGGSVSDDRHGEWSGTIRTHPGKARQTQRQRPMGGAGRDKGNVPLLHNADTPALAKSPKHSSVGQHKYKSGLGGCAPVLPGREDVGKGLLRAAMTQLGMSARPFHRILKLARTIADLEGAADLQTLHLAEAIEYRPRRQL